MRVRCTMVVGEYASTGMRNRQGKNRCDKNKKMEQREKGITTDETNIVGNVSW